MVTDMMTNNNNMKRSAAILIFFLSAAAWIGSDSTAAPQDPAKSETVHADNPNAGIVLHPLTD